MAPIDARIPLAALGNDRPPLDVAGTIYRSQAAHAMQAEAQRKQQEALKQQQIDALAQQYPDPEDYLREVAKIDPFYAAKTGEQIAKYKKEVLSGHIEKLKFDTDKLTYWIRTAQTTRDDPNKYAAWRQTLVQRDPEMDQYAPKVEEWMLPGVQDRFFSMGVTMKDALDNEADLAKEYREGKGVDALLYRIGRSPSLDVANALIEGSAGFLSKKDINYARGILASSPDWETAKQNALAASGKQQFQHVTIDEGGKPVIGAFDPDTGDVLSTGARATTAGSENEPLVAVLRNGRPVLVRRSEAEGATPAPTGAAADTGPHPGDPELVSSILKFPGLFQGLSDKTKERLLPALTAAGFAPAGGEQADLDKVGLMVIDNPDLLKEFPAKDRSKILTHIATAGGEFPNKRKAKVAQMASSALATLRQMKNHPGFKGAVGAKGPTSLFGYMETPMAGTNAADFVRLSEALKSQITLPNLELMKGLGAMSDREFKTMSDAATALDRSMTEDAYRLELKRLEDTLTGMAGATPTTPPPTQNPFRKPTP